jgi:hypothetical protein
MIYENNGNYKASTRAVGKTASSTTHDQCFIVNNVELERAIILSKSILELRALVRALE